MCVECLHHFGCKASQLATLAKMRDELSEIFWSQRTATTCGTPAAQNAAPALSEWHALR